MRRPDGAIALLLASALVVWPSAWVWRRLRSHDVRYSPRARWLAATTALLVLGFLGAFTSAVLGTLEENPYILAFGLPANQASIFVLPWAALLAALAKTVYAVTAWRSRWWSATARVHYTLVALAGLGAAVWLGFSGLL